MVVVRGRDRLQRPFEKEKNGFLQNTERQFAQTEWTSDRKGTWTKWSKSGLRNENPLNIQEKYIVL